MYLTIFIVAALGIAIWLYVRSKRAKAAQTANATPTPMPRPATTGVLPRFGAVAQTVQSLRAYSL